MKQRRVFLLAPVFLTGILAVVLAIMPTLAMASGGSFIGPFNKVSTIASTVPGNGDQNPYGTFVVPTPVGNLVQGDILVSNFNNGANLQGTGTTIMEVDKAGTPPGAGCLFGLAVVPNGSGVYFVDDCSNTLNLLS